MKDPVIEFDLGQVVAVVALESADDCVEVSLLYETHVLGVSMIHCKRPCTFLPFLVHLPFQCF